MYKLRLKGIEMFLNRDLSVELLELYLRIEKVEETRANMSRSMDKLHQRRYDFKTSENELIQFNDEERAYKQMLRLEQFPEYKNLLTDYFNRYSHIEKDYETKFKPLVPNATHKFLELEEEEFLSVTIEENVSKRKLHLELLENLNKSVSKGLEVLYRCL